MTDYAGTPKGVSTPDWATLAAQLREVVRLQACERTTLSEHGTLADESFDAMANYGNAIGTLCDTHAPALLALAEAAERGPVGWMRYLDGKPDWAEDCLLSEPSYRDEDAFPDEDGYCFRPLYALTGPKDQT